MKTAVIDVGGCFRGVYAAGVFDYCLENDINFDMGFGVSAGADNIMAYTTVIPKIIPTAYLSVLSDDDTKNTQLRYVLYEVACL